MEITGLDPRKDKKLSCVQLEDFPDEIKVKIGLIRDNGIRASSSDDSFWLQLNLKGHVPLLLEKAVENGCRYLSLTLQNPTRGMILHL